MSFKEWLCSQEGPIIKIKGRDMTHKKVDVTHWWSLPLSVTYYLNLTSWNDKRKRRLNWQMLLHQVIHLFVVAHKWPRVKHQLYLRKMLIYVKNTKKCNVTNVLLKKLTVHYCQLPETKWSGPILAILEVYGMVWNL